jgi:prephenate dehydrogenase
LDRITIIGMGPLGASIGLALRRANLEDTEVVGADKDRKTLSRALKMGAADRATGNLREALDGAQLVVLDTPLSDTAEMLEAIGPVLEDGCVVTDTGRVKAPVAQWAERHLPRHVGFVGGRPLPARPATSLDDADAAVLDGASYCVIIDESTDPTSIKTVVGMVEAMGASPLFMSAQEHDSYSAALALLPVLLSAALVNTAAESPTWGDMSRLAGPEFGELSQLAAGDPREAAAECLASRDALSHWLGQMASQLIALRGQVEDGGDDLLDTLVRAWEQRARWEAGAVEGTPGFDSPSAAQGMASMVFGGHLTRRYRQITGGDKGPAWRYPGRRGPE